MLPTDITVGRWEIRVRVKREGLIAQTAIGTLTGATVRKRLLDKVGVEESLYPWKRHIIESFDYAPVIVDGKTTGDEIWIFKINQLENPVPVVAIIAGIATLAGLLLIYLTVEDLKPIINEAPVLFAGIGFGIVAIILIPLGLWAYRTLSRSS